ETSVGVYQVLVTTNFTNTVWEQGATANNTFAAGHNLTVTVKPRPDLQVSAITIPDHVPAGGTLTAQFTVLNQGGVATNVPNWVDRVYLSLDTVISQDDVFMGEIGNQSALGAGASYTSQ